MLVPETETAVVPEADRMEVAQAMAVSYTHLDVYKRQHEHRPPESESRAEQPG